MEFEVLRGFEETLENMKDDANATSVLIGMSIVNPGFHGVGHWVTWPLSHLYSALQVLIPCLSTS